MQKTVSVWENNKSVGPLRFFLAAPVATLFKKHQGCYRFNILQLNTIPSTISTLNNTIE